MKRSTPWGQADYSRAQAEGITWHSTPGHGGIELSEERMRAMPASLLAFKPWAGRGWYEEDCDWCIPCLAFPMEFEPRSCYYAAMQARSDYIRKRIGADYFAPSLLGPTCWDVVQQRAAEWAATPEGAAETADHRVIAGEV
jgi:hypothetical protein